MLSIICANGLGHFRRAASVLARLRSRRPLELDVACEPWQRERLGHLLDGGEVRWRHDLGQPGVRWSADAADYDDGRLAAWEASVGRLDCSAYQLVVSDNLAAPLAQRPDVVLLGSFLWSEVLPRAHPQSAPVREFAARERALLQQHRPPMLCVGALAMDAVLDGTDAVRCAPMCLDALPDPLPAEPVTPRRVAILGGATEAARRPLLDAAELLAERGDLELVAPARLGLDLPDFAFEAADYRAVDAVVCRPGVGTLQDALAAGKPALCCYEAGQPEMMHNAARVAALGLGADLGPAPTRAALDEGLALDRAAYAEARARIGSDGLERAADWLDARLEELCGP